VPKSVGSKDYLGISDHGSILMDAFNVTSY